MLKLRPLCLLVIIGAVLALSAAQLDVESLPPLEEVLQELQLEHYEQSFYELGVSETQYLLSLRAMDYRIMKMEWGLQPAEADRLKAKIEELRKVRLVHEEREDPLLRRRSQLTYGRLYLNNSVQSFEYFLAAFGSPPPIGWRPLKLADPAHGCDEMTDPSVYEESIVVMRRGECSFLQKALHATHGGAEAVVIVNSERSLLHMGSGAGFEESVNGTELPLKIAAVSVSSASWDPIATAINSGEVVQASIVPLECKTGESACSPILEQEQVIPSTEILWGELEVHPTTNLLRSLMRAEFLTSTFGGVLPHGRPLEPVLATSALDGCAPQPLLKDNNNKVLVVVRGNCTFGVKAANAQGAGARMLIVVQTDDNPLQRIGASGDIAETIGIPATLITTEAGDRLLEVLSSCVSMESSAEASSSCVRLSVRPHRDRNGAEAWSSLAHTPWSDDTAERAAQLSEALRYHNMQGERRSWIQRQLAALDAQ